MKGIDDNGNNTFLPLNFADILSVSVGSVLVKNSNSLIGTISGLNSDCSSSNSSLNNNATQQVILTDDPNIFLRPLDSYQEEDLERIRDQWLKALNNRHNYLKNQIKEVCFYEKE